MFISPKSSSIVLTLMLATALSGCASSDGTGSPFDLMNIRVDALGLSDGADIPTTGTANYTGLIEMQVDRPAGGSDDVTGDMSMTADFDGEDISGSMSNFTGDNVGNIGGSIIFETVPGEYAGGTGFNAPMTGNLVVEGSSAAVDDGFFLGTFYGPNAEGVAGAFFGGLDYDDPADADGNIVGGKAIAELDD